MKSSNSFYRPDDLIQLGKIIGAHGIRGALKVYSYAETADGWSAHSDLIIQAPGGERTSYAVIQCQPYKQVVRVTLKEVTTRSEAEALAGYDILVPRSSLPPLDEDTYYWHDLIGMAVYTTEDHHLGIIDHIIPTGANDVYVIKPAEGDPAGEILIPAIASVVIDVDTETGRMVVTLPEGL